MATMQINLRDDLAQRLAEESRRLGITVEQLVELGIGDFLAKPDDRFEKIAARIVRDNKELYRRLT